MIVAIQKLEVLFQKRKASFSKSQFQKKNVIPTTLETAIDNTASSH